MTRVGDGGSSLGDEVNVTESTKAMELREERMAVDKRPVAEGEVTVRKDVVTEQQTVDVPVAHEEVSVTRRPVSEDDYGVEDGKLGTIKPSPFRLCARKFCREAPDRNGEVAINKRRVKQPQTISATVRKERPAVETSGDVDDNVDSSF